MRRTPMVKNCFRLSSTAGEKTCCHFFPVPPFSHQMEFHVVKRFLSLDVTVEFLVYMEKLVCLNSDSGQEAIRDKYQHVSGRDWG